MVARYAGNGRKLGYPTANIAARTDLADGVYFGRADLGDFWAAAALVFVGTPTTVGDQDRRVEAHLLDVPDHDHYGEKLILRDLHFHRESVTFGSLEALIEAMKADETAAREWFRLA